MSDESKVAKAVRRAEEFWDKNKELPKAGASNALSRAAVEAFRSGGKSKDTPRENTPRSSRRQ